MSDWLVYGVPALAVAIGGGGVFITWMASLSFDRRHPGADGLHSSTPIGGSTTAR